MKLTSATSRVHWYKSYIALAVLLRAFFTFQIEYLPTLEFSEVKTFLHDRIWRCFTPISLWISFKCCIEKSNTSRNFYCIFSRPAHLQHVITSFTLPSRAVIKSRSRLFTAWLSTTNLNTMEKPYKWALEVLMGGCCHFWIEPGYFQFLGLYAKLS